MTQTAKEGLAAIKAAGGWLVGLMVFFIVLWVIAAMTGDLELRNTDSVVIAVCAVGNVLVLVAYRALRAVLDQLVTQQSAAKQTDASVE